jgi:hypothetical protein
VIGHRHRDRHVDADHADLDRGGEVARGVAVAGEDRVPLPYSWSLISFERLVVGLGAHDREHRPEDLFLVDLHVGRHVVEQAAAEKKPFS